MLPVSVDASGLEVRQDPAYGRASAGPALLLREDLSKEYYALLGVVSSYDGWLLIVKGWSVTLSLAALGLGFQQGTTPCSSSPR